MKIGDRVQTLNTFAPITGEIVDMYKNLVTIADDDAETGYFLTEDLESAAQFLAQIRFEELAQ